MFRGFQGDLRIPVEAPMPEFNPSVAVDARSIFREPPPPPKPLIQKLGELPASAARDELLSRFALISREVEYFVFQAKADRIAELERQRDLQRHACRAAEDALKTIRIDMANANANLGDHGAELNAARRAQVEAERPPFDSNYPMPAETAAWNEKRAAARVARNAAEQRHQELQQAILVLTYQFETAAKALNAADEALRALDSELRNLKST